MMSLCMKRRNSVHFTKTNPKELYKKSFHGSGINAVQDKYKEVVIMDKNKPELPICSVIRATDKETILFELGFVWGICRKLDDDDYAMVVDSLVVIKSIIDNY